MSIVDKKDLYMTGRVHHGKDSCHIRLPRNKPHQNTLLTSLNFILVFAQPLPPMRHLLLLKYRASPPEYLEYLEEHQLTHHHQKLTIVLPIDWNYPSPIFLIIFLDI